MIKLVALICSTVPKLHHFQRMTLLLISILFAVILINLTQYPHWLSHGEDYEIPPVSLKLHNENVYKDVYHMLPTFIEFRKHFTDWKLIGFDRSAVLFLVSGDFKSDYLGAASTQVVAYDPTLTEQELSKIAGYIGPSFTQQQNWLAVVVPPSSASSSVRTVIILRSSTGKLFLTPLSLAPKRFQWLLNAQ